MICHPTSVADPDLFSEPDPDPVKFAGSSAGSGSFNFRSLLRTCCRSLGSRKNHLAIRPVRRPAKAIDSAQLDSGHPPSRHRRPLGRLSGGGRGCHRYAGSPTGTPGANSAQRSSSFGCDKYSPDSRGSWRRWEHSSPPAATALTDLAVEGSCEGGVRR